MEIIEEFVKKKDGKKTYRSWLVAYFETLKVNPNTYFTNGRKYDKDVITFVESIESWAPATKKSATSCIKNFLKFNNVRLEPKTEYSLKEYCKGPRAISQERIPTRKELKEILSYGAVKHKALFLMMSSSGMRPGEAIRITLDDIFMDETPGRIEVPYYYTKTQESRTTFVSNEARHYLRQWIKIREQYKKSNRNSAKANDKRIFPFSIVTLRDMWVGLITKAGYAEFDEINVKIDKNGTKRQRYKMTPHKLRKFFKTEFSNAGLPFEIVEALMGHEEGVSAVYRRYSPEQLKDWYLKGEESLLVFERPTNQDDIDSMRSQLEIMQNQMQELLKQTPWYQNAIIEPISEEPIIDDAEAVKEYEKQKQTIEDIKEEGLELWGMKQRGRAKIKK